MNNFTIVDQEIIGAMANGVNYGANMKVIARTPEVLLVWIPGSSCRGGGYHLEWHPATMAVIARAEHGWRGLRKKQICSGERCHQRVFERYADKIDDLMGEGFHHLLDMKKTVVVGENKPFSRSGYEMPITGREFGYELVKKQQEAYTQLIAAGATGLGLHTRAQNV